MWYWWVSGIVVWLVSGMCMIGTVIEMKMGKYGWADKGFWGAVAFHGVSAILALWLVWMAVAPTT